MIKQLSEPQDGAFIFGQIDASAWTTDGNLRVAMAPLAPQQSDGMLAVITAGGDQFVQNLAPGFLASLSITLA
ncbi:MAG: hypothetical protein M1132_04890 [Chloroflexi bacterium]|nr:hypothetical protein [Chloroflexota bacterium]